MSGLRIFMYEIRRVDQIISKGPFNSKIPSPQAVLAYREAP